MDQASIQQDTVDLAPLLLRHALIIDTTNNMQQVPPQPKDLNATELDQIR